MNISKEFKPSSHELKTSKIFVKSSLINTQTPSPSDKLDSQAQKKLHLMMDHIHQELKTKFNYFSEDSRYTDFNFHKFCLAELACALFSTVGIALAILAYDVGFITDGGFTYTQLVIDISQGDQIEDLLLWLVVASTLILWPLIIIRYHLKVKWLKSRKITGPEAQFFSKYNLFFLISEIFIMTIVPNPFFKNTNFYTFNEVEGLDVKYNSNDFLSLLVLLRFVILMRIFMVNSVYYSNKSHRICNLYGCEANYMYVTKCLIQMYPLRITLLCIVSCIFLFGYALKISERPLMNLMKEDNIVDPGKTFFEMDISNYYNAIWCIVVTMATVGYGDFAPKTIPGRSIGFLACISGSICVSLLVLTLQNLLNPNSSETKVMSIIDRITIKKKRRKQAAFALLYFTKIYYLGKTQKIPDWEKIKTYVSAMRYHLNQLSELKSVLKIFDENAGFIQLMKRQFEFLNRDFELLKEKCFLLTEINDIVCRKKIKKMASSVPYSKRSLGEMMIGSRNMIKRDSVINIETPLLNVLMKKKRIQDYKEKTKLIQGNLKRINE